MALSKLGFDVSGGYYDGISPRCLSSGYYALPAGCSIRNGGDNLIHFVPCRWDVGTGRNDLIPICKGNLDTGTTFIFICLRKRIHITRMIRTF